MGEMFRDNHNTEKFMLQIDKIKQCMEKMGKALRKDTQHRWDKDTGLLFVVSTTHTLWFLCWQCHVLLFTPTKDGLQNSRALGPDPPSPGHA